MPFEVTDCSIIEMQAHPRLADRTNARLRVRLQETNASDTIDHDLVIRVWTDTRPGMSVTDIQSALLMRAAAIIRRTIASAELSEQKAAE